MNDLRMSLPLSPTMQEITNRVDLSQLYPPFTDLWLEALSNLEEKGHRFYATSGKRDLEEQRKLYSLGRVEEGGVWTIIDAEKVRTNARPGHSAHNYAIAGDACRDKDRDRAGLQPSWDLDSYEVYAEECRNLGLDAAFYWVSFREGPHAQLNLRRYSITTWRLFQLYEQGGLSDVFNYLDAFQWRR